MNNEVEMSSRFSTPFRIRDSFMKEFPRNREPNWQPIGKVVFYRTYSRIRDNGTKETFIDVVRRCVEGSINLLMRSVDCRESLAKTFDPIVNQYFSSEKQSGLDSVDIISEKMFRYMFDMVFLPPGRGMWMMGTDYAMERSGISLNNCAMVSTRNLGRNLLDNLSPFGFLMDVSMLGAGCGFDTEGAGTREIFIPSIRSDKNMLYYRIPDSREGWVESLELLIESYINPNMDVVSFDYSLIRKYGEPIRGFGGTASGFEPLRELHERVRFYFEREYQECVNNGVTPIVSSRVIVDIINAIGACVVAGNVRRSSLIAMGEIDDIDFRLLKDYSNAKNAYRQAIGGYSNNSVIIRDESVIDRDIIESLVKQTVTNGEPGYLFLDHCRNFGRMVNSQEEQELNLKRILNGAMSDKDADGTNPCAEMTLFDRELCNLVEMFPSNIIDDSNLSEELMRVTVISYIYAKSVTNATAHLPTVQKHIENNRRLGISISGIALCVEKYGLENFGSLLDGVYKNLVDFDIMFSKSLGMPPSVKLTTVKPSGTISLVAGVTSGVHYPMGKFYVKRMRISTDDPLVQWASDSGFHVEKAITWVSDGNDGWVESEQSSTSIIEFPIKFHVDVPSRDEVPLQKQMEVIKMMQRCWSDNQVSATVTYHDHEIKEIEDALERNCTIPEFKSISFLKNFSFDFPQMPESKIDAREFDSLMSGVSMVDIEKYIRLQNARGESGCTNDTCTL